MSDSSSSPPTLRNNGLTSPCQSTISNTEKPSSWPELEGADTQTDIHNGSPDPPKESSAMGDKSLSPVPTAQRKLPIPATGANSNGNLKGMLIKPKRILPAQPDSLKGKRSQSESGSPLKSPTADEDKSRINNVLQVGNTIEDLTHKQTILPKLQIDVDRLKTYYLTQSNEGSERKKSSVNGSGIQAESGHKTVATFRSQGQSGYSPHTCITREAALCNHSPDGVTKVREWCSPGDNKMATKTDTTTVVNGRNIRSPSPKSNTTWDRSSSGYSSDERADPRSPPPKDTGSVASKTESIITVDDSVSEAQIKSEQEESLDEAPSDSAQENASEKDSVNLDIDIVDDDCDNKVSSDNEEDVLIDTKDSEATSGICLCTITDGANNNNNNTGETEQKVNSIGSKEDTLVINNSNSALTAENVLGLKPQIHRRPTYQMSGPPASGRIQYRKSGSEPMISLRHPSRQSAVSENNLDGLEVCGKSYPQVTPGDSLKLDLGTRSDTNTPTSAFTPIEKSVTSSDTAYEPVPRIEIGKQDSAVKNRIMRQHFASPRSPRDIKNITLSLAGKLSVGGRDCDIRKTLHDLNSPRRGSPSGKTAPIRARHIIQPTSGNANQPMSTADAQVVQPMGVSFVGFQRVNNNSDNKQTVKFFGKKMWRPPQGQPENAQMRPFSPFGGTLPPSKIKENEEKRHSIDPDG